MNVEKFEECLNNRIEKCKAVLLKKEDEYATEDRLHNFKVAAELQGVNPLTALAGMMAKHTVSVYDLIRETALGDRPPLDMWDEKIGDSINYLFLLDAAVGEMYIGEREGRSVSYKVYEEGQTDVEKEKSIRNAYMVNETPRCVTIDQLKKLLRMSWGLILHKCG